MPNHSLESSLYSHRQLNLFLYISIFELSSCVVLGGGTRGGFLSDAILQLLSIPVLLVAVWRILEAPGNPGRRRALAFCGVIVALPLLQLLPLPPVVWTHLPGRETIAESFQLIGRPLAWVPISMVPEETWLAAFSLLPPLAIFLSTLTLDWRERRVMSFALIALSVVSVFLGLLQLAQGPASDLRFFEFTNPDDSVGFFANRNHYSALLYCAIILSATILAPQLAALSVRQKRRRQGDETSYILGAILAGIALNVLIAGEVMARSRAGIILMGIALLAGVVIASDRARLGNNLDFHRAFTAIVALAILILGQSAFFRVLGRFDVDPLADTRWIVAGNTIAAAKSVMPIGSGIGSFPSIYPSVERPTDLIAGTYLNHAHNDLLEMWLETGFAGPILLVVFVIWVGRKGIAAWAAPDPHLSLVDRALVRGAVFVILLLLGHSLVDYPLRTGAMMATFAFACGLLVDSPIVRVPTAAQSAQGHVRKDRRKMISP